jgi:arginyl-tRNA synthetase
MRLLETVRSGFEPALHAWSDDSRELLQRITATRDSQFGDYQANLSLVMTLAKQTGQAPIELAQSICQSLQSNALFSKVEVAGKGFINLQLNDQTLLKWLGDLERQPKLPASVPTAVKTYVVDFSSPNVAKPLHVGHIRSTVIGDAIVRSLRYLGHRVISDNHLGDWGTQFGMVIYGYRNFADQAAYESDPVAELSRVYRVVQQIVGYQEAKSQVELQRRRMSELTSQLSLLKQKPADSNAQSPEAKKLAKEIGQVERNLKDAANEQESTEKKIKAVEENPVSNELALQHPHLESKVLQETAKLHAGDEANLALWKQFLPHCKAEIQRIYDLLGVQFDYELGESFYHEQLGPTVEALMKSGTAVESNGAICVFLEGFEAPMLIRKQDGAFLYATTDLATVEYRMQTFAPDAILYVVDHRQGDHFKKLFACLKKIGLEKVELRHVSFGTVLGKDKRPFKTREGVVLGLESLLDEAVDRALSVVCDPERLKKASLDMSDEEKRHIARVVGIGAIKYADLSHHRENDYEFDNEKMVALEGNTAAYIQYSFARTQNILKKLAEKPVETADQSSDDGLDSDLAFEHPLERSLGIQLLRFEDAVQSSMVDYLPSVITEYLYELARLFASFFDQCPVLKAESASQRRTRRLLVSLTGKTLKQGLDLLNIQTVDRM